MKIKPLIWLRELIATALKSQTKRLSPEKYFSRLTHRNRLLTYLKFTEQDFKSSPVP